MAQYIDKDDLVKAIDRQKIGYNVDGKHTVEYDITRKILDIINALEVKEVDSLTPEEIKKICTIYDNLNQERKCATILYNSDETFFNHVLMEYKTIAQKGE